MCIKKEFNLDKILDSLRSINAVKAKKNEEDKCKSLYETVKRNKNVIPETKTINDANKNIVNKTSEHFVDFNESAYSIQQKNVHKNNNQYTNPHYNEEQHQKMYKKNKTVPPKKIIKTDTIKCPQKKPIPTLYVTNEQKKFSQGSVNSVEVYPKPKMVKRTEANYELAFNTRGLNEKYVKPKTNERIIHMDETKSQKNRNELSKSRKRTHSELGQVPLRDETNRISSKETKLRGDKNRKKFDSAKKHTKHIQEVKNEGKVKPIKTRKESTNVSPISAKSIQRNSFNKNNSNRDTLREVRFLPITIGSESEKKNNKQPKKTINSEITKKIQFLQSVSTKEILNANVVSSKKSNSKSDISKPEFNKSTETGKYIPHSIRGGNKDLVGYIDRNSNESRIHGSGKHRRNRVERLLSVEQRDTRRGDIKPNTYPYNNQNNDRQNTTRKNVNTFNAQRNREINGRNENQFAQNNKNLPVTQSRNTIRYVDFNKTVSNQNQKFNKNNKFVERRFYNNSKNNQFRNQRPLTKRQQRNQYYRDLYLQRKKQGIVPRPVSNTPTLLPVDEIYTYISREAKGSLIVQNLLVQKIRYSNQKKLEEYKRQQKSTKKNKQSTRVIKFRLDDKVFEFFKKQNKKSKYIKYRKKKKKKSVNNLMVPYILVLKIKTFMNMLAYNISSVYNFQLKKLKIFIFKLHDMNVSASYIARYIALKLLQKYPLNFIVKNVLNFFLRKRFQKNIVGFKICCSGRVSRKQRATYYWKSYGLLSTSSCMSKLDYFFCTVPLKFGAAGVKVWVLNGKTLKHDL
jgi:ribosomal protein S3